VYVSELWSLFMDRRYFLHLLLGSAAATIFPASSFLPLLAEGNLPEPFDVYLTFDDGPFSEPDLKSGPTDNALQILQDYNVQATFFLHGRHILDRHGPVLTRYINDGHAVGNHLWSQGGNLVKNNTGLVRLAYQYLLTEVRIRKVMKAADENAFTRYMEQPKLFRRPGGKNGLNEFLNLSNLRLITYAEPMKLLRREVSWLKGVYDYSGWHINGGEAIPIKVRPLTPIGRLSFILNGGSGYQGVMNYLQVGTPPHYSNEAKAGLIILFHDFDVGTRAMLPELINKLRELGATFRPLPRPIDKPNSFTVGIGYAPTDTE
jgi:peptidoglycan/xylan/chitin deacetylase (PgdA/CDA1 family)